MAGPWVLPLVFPLWSHGCANEASVGTAVESGFTYSVECCHPAQFEGAILSGKNTAAFGIYSPSATVESGVDAFKSSGFRHTDISVLFPENAGSQDFAHTKDTKAPEGVGGAIGGFTGTLIGMGIWSMKPKDMTAAFVKGAFCFGVHSDDAQWTKLAKDILVLTDAQDIASTGEA